MSSFNQIQNPFTSISHGVVKIARMILMEEILPANFPQRNADMARVQHMINPSTVRGE
ncbi:MAG: hypothetical protein ABIW47_12310 [Ginsengibacter sp.]|jgi:hypothetical protein